MFKWTHGGQRVFLTGTFNNWAKEGIPMVRSGQEFYQILEISKGVHEYKFLVDGDWKFSHEQPVLQDTGGNVNNVVDIQYYEKYEPVPLKDPLDVSDVEEDEFDTEIIEPTTQTAEPPSAPPLLLKFPAMGLASGRKTQGIKVLSTTGTQANVNIPLFCVNGHVMHDAALSFKPFGSDALVTSSTVRFAQKFSTNVLVTLNTSARSDGLIKHYGVTIPEAGDVQLPAPPGGMHALHKALLGETKPRRPEAPVISRSFRSGESIGSEDSATRRIASPNSSRRNNIDISIFTD
jgi:hypothetical protein